MPIRSATSTFVNISCVMRRAQLHLQNHRAGSDSVLVCLQEQRSRIREFAQAKAERDGKQADEGQAAYSKADLDAMWAEVSTLRAERDTLKGIVDSLKKPLEEHMAAADELWKKKSDKRREYVRAPPLILLWLPDLTP